MRWRLEFYCERRRFGPLLVDAPTPASSIRFASFTRPREIRQPHQTVSYSAVWPPRSSLRTTSLTRPRLWRRLPRSSVVSSTAGDARRCAMSFSTMSERLRGVFAQAGTVELAAVVTDRDTGRSRGRSR